MTDDADAIVFPTPYEPIRQRLAARRIFEGEAVARLTQADRAQVRVMVVSGGQPLGPAEMDAYPNLGRIVAIGAGFDGVDTQAAAARGIQVVSGAGANAEDVADWAAGALIAAARGFFPNDAKVRAGAWVWGDFKPVRSLSAMTVGIVGLGHIGRAVGRRLEPFRCRLAWQGPRPKADAPYPYISDLRELARLSDALVLAAPLDAATAGMVDAAVLEALGPAGILVNVGRGGLVDEEALIAALKSGGLAAAALDVFAQEPTPAQRWSDVPNVILSPHTAAVTHEALGAVFDLAARNVTDFLDAPR